MLPPDFVIIGAGLAGISLGVRLTENPAISVTVLEAGGAAFHDVDIDTPAYFLNNIGNTTKDWGFFSSSQPNLGDRPVYLPRGKRIGGSSLLNFMEVNRAAATEYDAFESLGSAGWSWGSLLPYFRRSENLTYNAHEAADYDMHFNQNFQGTTGPVEITIPRFLDVVAQPFVGAAKAALGLKSNPDPNEGDNTGTWLSTRTVNRYSIRSSAASSYYEPVQSRPNLKVITNAQATRILISGEDVVATGVQYIKDGKLLTINATREVILSAGTYQSPQLLELSGIGDPAVLKKFDIPVVVDLPGVGNNLRKPFFVRLGSPGFVTKFQEHVTLSYTAKMTPGYDAWGNMSNPIFAAKQEEIYKTTGDGMLSGVPSAFAFLPFKNFDTNGSITRLVDTTSLSDSVTHKIQKSWVKNGDVPFLELSAFDRFTPGATDTAEPNTNYVSSDIILLHPFSRGSVHLNSSNPLSTPTIDINILDSDIDLQIAIQGIKLIRSIYHTSPLNALVRDEVSPGADVQSDEDITAYIRKTAGVTFHPIATSSMLPRKDGGVVDANFRVYGTKNIRVVDASIIPVSISAHLQATTYAIAEKAADIIKAAC